jgi:rRNA-processing protein FCF1
MPNAETCEELCDPKKEFSKLGAVLLKNLRTFFEDIELVNRRKGKTEMPNEQKKTSDRDTKRFQAEQAFSDCLAESMVILDTSFAMHRGLECLVARDLLKPGRHRIYIPQKVHEELLRLWENRMDPVARLAENGLELIRRLQAANMAYFDLLERRHQYGYIADQAIIELVIRHMKSRDLIVLTNDFALTNAILAISAVVKRRCSLSVYSSNDSNDNFAYWCRGSV